MRPVIEALKAAGIEILDPHQCRGLAHTKNAPRIHHDVEDHINQAGMNPLIGSHGDENFVPMTDAYDPRLQKALGPRRRRKNSNCITASMSGFPALPSKPLPKSAWSANVGGAAVGMSTVPETILARRFGLRVAALSVITNLGRRDRGRLASHEETKREGAKAAERMKTLLTRFFKDLK